MGKLLSRDINWNNSGQQRKLDVGRSWWEENLLQSETAEMWNDLGFFYILKKEEDNFTVCF